GIRDLIVTEFRRVLFRSSQVPRLVSSGEAAIVGVVLAEVLQGARTQDEFEVFHRAVLAAEFLACDQADWVRAAAIGFELGRRGEDRKSTRLNSSHDQISY